MRQITRQRLLRLLPPRSPRVESVSAFCPLDAGSRQTPSLRLNNSNSDLLYRYRKRMKGTQVGFVLSIRPRAHRALAVGNEPAFELHTIYCVRGCIGSDQERAPTSTPSNKKGWQSCAFPFQLSPCDHRVCHAHAHVFTRSLLLFMQVLNQKKRRSIAKK